MIIQSNRVWIAGTFYPAQIEIEGTIIKAIHEYGKLPVDHDYGNKRIVPGFIEVHAHGAYGFDTNDANDEGLRNWISKLPREGVTSILTTTVTQSHEVLSKAVSNVARFVKTPYEGAEVLGIHFEGPYLDMKYKGAQPEEYIAKPTIKEFKEYQEAAEGLIKYITLAPETDEDYELVRYASQHGVVVSIGHSAATEKDCMLAIANGAKSFTHTFNGMTPLNHREPGCVGTILRTHTYSEIICDGQHVKPSVLNTLFTSKGKDRMIAITDSLCAKGNPPGYYELGGNEITINEHGTAILKKTGGIAGSTLFSNKGLRVLVEDALIPFEAALNAFTKNPAEVLEVDDHKGRLVAGYDADIVVLEDNYDIHQTYARGKAQL